VVVVATQTGIARYDTTLFSVHMVQHVLLTMVAAPLLAAGAPTALAVTAYDGLVVARTAFESSIRYRSAVLFGSCSPVTDEKERLLDLVTERLLPGRVTEVRRPTKAELAATLLLALPIDDWSLKVSDDWPEDEPADVAGPAWAGVVPLRQVYDAPLAAPDLAPGIGIPPSVQALRER